jgi:hypothetical protein
VAQPWLEKILALRVHQPDAVSAAAARRHRIDIASRGRLLIVAADHAARGALGSGRDPMAMGSRVDLIERLRAALANPGVHGVLGTADVLEDLLLLGALEGKLVFGSMNRGGLAGSTFELDDRFTGFTAAAIEDRDFDGGKMLLRIDPGDPATAGTLESCARAIDELAARKLIAMIEPFWSGRLGGRVRNDLSPDAMIRAIAVASGLGSTSAYSWLKVPVVDEMERVMEASTLPALLLGGESAEDPDTMFERWRKALALPTVRGLVVGRNLLYPADGDVVGAVETAVGLL